MRIKWSKYGHLAFLSLDVLNFLNNNRNGPNPIGVDEEKSIKELKA